ncbi:OmpP1/FadL family transporter [Salinibacter ruber]|uniref:OmpP1/FadL family transporter n=1 Tax=Salinibacter ruber TaxID=146919 RepID=UPI001F0823D0|nr:outer membrane protein transport protein [Salinibacter ruber]
MFLVAGLWAPSLVQAQGFGVYEQGSCAMARAGAAVADGCSDGSSIYFNPANISSTSGITVSLGGTLIAAQGSYTSGITGRESDLQNDPIPVPHLYATYRANDRLTVGLGTYVPYGLSTEWKSTFEGAFEGYNNAVQSIYIQPTISYQVTDWLTIGGGPILSLSAVELQQRLDLSQQLASGGDTPDTNDDVYFSQLGIPFHTAFGDTKLEATNETGFGGNIGVNVRATERLQFGARFMTPITVDFSGDATFTQVNTGLRLRTALGPNIPAGTPIDNLVADQFSGDETLTNQSIETELTFPAQVVVGTSFNATPQLTVTADYQWTGWSAVGEIPLDFEKDALDDERVLNYENTSAIRVGGQYQLNDRLSLRAGYLYNESAAPDATVTPLLPEAGRNQFTLGFGWRPVDLLEVNAAYQYLGQNDRLGRVRDVRVGEEVSSLSELNEGIYSFDAHLVGLTLTLYL